MGGEINENVTDCRPSMDLRIKFHFGQEVEKVDLKDKKVWPKDGFDDVPFSLSHPFIPAQVSFSSVAGGVDPLAGASYDLLVGADGAAR